jgi:hypothetical protein
MGMLEINQKIICINNRSLSSRIFPLVVGRIYTIRDIMTDVPEHNRGVVLLLNEIINNLHADGERAYYSDRFRPLVERKTSIEVFQKMLNPSPEKVLNHIMSDTLADIYSAEQ